MSGVLIIGEEQKREIAAALTAARAKPVPWQAMMDSVDPSGNPATLLKDRKPGVTEVRRTYRSQRVQLGTYDTAISFEEQPAGIIKHLSVSSLHAGKVPGPYVMQMVCEAFGFSKWLCEWLADQTINTAPTLPYRIFLEEFEPGHSAVNILELEPEDSCPETKS